VFDKTICIEIITKNKHPINTVLPMQQNGLNWGSPPAGGTGV
jgi:hypothetical protein